MTSIILDADTEVLVSGVKLEDFQGQNLVIPTKSSSHGVSLKRNTSHWVGSLVVGGQVIIVPPQFEPSLFVDFYLYANGANVLTWDNSNSAAAADFQGQGNDAFLVLLASIFVDQVQRVIGHNLAKKYVEKTERLPSIKGRPIWPKDFGRHASEGKTCRFYELSHQNKLNEAVLTGLEYASSILQGTPHLPRCKELIFQWRGIIGSYRPSSTIVYEALEQLTRLTEHYRTPLLIAQALVEKCQTDVFGSSQNVLPTLEFYLPSLFEKFAYRLVRESLAGTQFRAKEQVFDNKALIDGAGDKYRSIIPDIMLYKARRVIGIIDAKFKPRYVTGVPGTKIPKKHRVTNADIYQLFFYQSRIAKKYPDFGPPPTAIVAPLFGSTELVSDCSRRKVVWTDGENAGSDFMISVLPIPMEAVFNSISKGESAKEALRFAPELRDFLNKGLTDATSMEEGINNRADLT